MQLCNVISFVTNGLFQVTWYENLNQWIFIYDCLSCKVAIMDGLIGQDHSPQTPNHLFFCCCFCKNVTSNCHIYFFSLMWVALGISDNLPVKWPLQKEASLDSSLPVIHNGTRTSQWAFRYRPKPYYHKTALMGWHYRWLCIKKF